MKTMIRVLLLAGAALIYGLADSPADAAEPQVWIYLYAHENSEPVRVLEVTSPTDTFGQCEFFRDLLDLSLGQAHGSAFFTCVTTDDLAKGVQL